MTGPLHEVRTLDEIQEFIDGLQEYNHYLGMISPYRPGVRLFMTRVEYEIFTPDTPRNDLFHLHSIRWADGLWVLFSVPASELEHVNQIATECGVAPKAGQTITVFKEGQVESFPIHSKSMFYLENTPDHPIYKGGDTEVLKVKEEEQLATIFEKHWQTFLAGKVV